jgi:hypothetical protein
MHFNFNTVRVQKEETGKKYKQKGQDKKDKTKRTGSGAA